MVRAFVDDSGSGGDSQFYVLAGFKASAETWMAFESDWQHALDDAPAIDYFKMHDADHGNHLFKGWLPKDRRRKVNLLIDVIERHDVFAFSSAVAQEDYDSIMKPYVAKDNDSPYLQLFSFVLAAFSSHEHHYASGEPVDFTFDVQKTEEAPAKRLFEKIRDLTPFKGRVGTINYCDERKCLPLQAADLLAWQRRRKLCLPSEGTRPEHARLHSNPSRYHFNVVGHMELRRQMAHIQSMVARLNAGEVTSEEILSKLR